MGVHSINQHQFRLQTLQLFKAQKTTATIARERHTKAQQKNI